VVKPRPNLTTMRHARFYLGRNAPVATGRYASAHSLFRRSPLNWNICRTISAGNAAQRMMPIPRIEPRPLRQPQQQTASQLPGELTLMFHALRNCDTASRFHSFTACRRGRETAAGDRAPETVTQPHGSTVSQFAGASEKPPRRTALRKL
jgi:hypothetical protein